MHRERSVRRPARRAARPGAGADFRGPPAAGRSTARSKWSSGGSANASSADTSMRSGPATSSHSPGTSSAVSVAAFMVKLVRGRNSACSPVSHGHDRRVGLDVGHRQLLAIEARGELAGGAPVVRVEREAELGMAVRAARREALGRFGPAESRWSELERRAGARSASPAASPTTASEVAAQGARQLIEASVFPAAARASKARVPRLARRLHGSASSLGARVDEA